MNSVHWTCLEISGCSVSFWVTVGNIYLTERLPFYWVLICFLLKYALFLVFQFKINIKLWLYFRWELHQEIKELSYHTVLVVVQINPKSVEYNNSVPIKCCRYNKCGIPSPRDFNSRDFSIYKNFCELINFENSVA